LSPRRARAVTYGVVALLATVVIRATDGRSSPERPPVREGVAPAAPADTLTTLPPAGPAEHEDTLGRGESLGEVLARGGVSEMLQKEVLRAASALDMRRIPAGMRVVTRMAHPDSAPSEIVFHLSVDRLLRLRRSGNAWNGAEERMPWRTDTVVVSGTIRSSLHQAMMAASRGVLSASASQQLTWTLADVFEYRVDMSKDLQAGDGFRVLVERSTSPAGTSRVGRLLAASLTLSGQDHEAIRFERRGRGEYYDANGKSLRAAFLRAPLEFRRISSSYGFRRHPILGDVRKHKGTDYAASSGTPVRAIGDGVVQRAGWAGGYGNVLEIRHPNGYVTRYAHLRGFARGVRRGSHVSIGQKVAFVGTTGLSTAPHLHFEVLVGGVHRDPRAALRDKSGFPIGATERGAFTALRSRMLAAMDGHGATVASAGQGGTPAN
jgi:murein DD-endopeptidase MepM/ murein hydrolase activator NlpD